MEMQTGGGIGAGEGNGGQLSQHQQGTSIASCSTVCLDDIRPSTSEVAAAVSRQQQMYTVICDNVSSSEEDMKGKGVGKGKGVKGSETGKRMVKGKGEGKGMGGNGEGSKKREAEKKKEDSESSDDNDCKIVYVASTPPSPYSPPQPFFGLIGQADYTPTPINRGSKEGEKKEKGSRNDGEEQGKSEYDI